MSSNTRIWRLLLPVFLLCSSGLANAQIETAPTPTPTATDTIRGRIVGEGGRPVAGALVRAVVVRSAGGFGSDIISNANQDGVFELKDVPPGFSDITVIAPPMIVVDGIPDGGARPGDFLTIRMAKGAAITGKVVDETGAPLTGLVVTPELIRDELGARYADGYYNYYGGMVDDRGVYRLYGLSAGTYLLSAGRSPETYGRPVFLSDRVPTYYPSAPRSDASEVSVRLGAEVTNIDIVFRGAAGHSISGKVVGGGSSTWTVVELYRLNEPESFREAEVGSGAGKTSFLLSALDDGDYELEARAAGTGDGMVTSDRVRVRIRGADVNGVTLTLMPTTQISGRVELAADSKDEACVETTSGDAVAPVRLADVAIGYLAVAPTAYSPGRTGLKGDGTFATGRLSGSRYRLWAQIADDRLYVSKLEMTAAAPAKVDTAASGSKAASPSATSAAPSAIARDGVGVTRGKNVDGIRFVVATGAALVRGRIAPAKPGEPLPSRARVCLVPLDSKQKDDVIHYYEVEVQRDGTFDVRNVAPGEYLVATRVFPNDDRPDIEILPAAWDAADRTKLRAAAGKAGIRVTLSPCQRLESAVIRLAP